MAAVSRAEGPSPVPTLAPGWERHDVQTGLDAPLTRVVWTGTRFLAVDTVGGSLLDSTDGRTWHQQPRLADGSVGMVAVGPGRVLAVGTANVSGSAVAIWHSTDGLNWSAIPDAASLHGRDGASITMAAVVPAGDGWLAVGGEQLMCAPGPCLVRAVVWASPDGLQWTRQADTAALQDAEMTGVVGTQAGYVAVGDAARDRSVPDSPIRPAIWTSPDGRTWTRSDRLPVVTAAKDVAVVLDDVAVTGSRVVAVGHRTQGNGWAEAFAWWDEGGTWSTVEIGRFIPSQGVKVAAVPGGLLAIFVTGDDTTCARAIWSSANGSSWACIGNDPAFAASTISDAAVAQAVEVLVGYGTVGAVVWTAPPH